MVTKKVVFCYGEGDPGDVDFLKAVLSDEGKGDVAGDGHEGNRIQHGGGNSRHEICGAGAGGCDDDAGLSGGSGISVGRVGGALLVCRQNVIYTVTVVIELVINVDGLPAGITEHVGNALFEQHLNQYLSAVH